MNYFHRPLLHHAAGGKPSSSNSTNRAHEPRRSWSQSRVLARASGQTFEWATSTKRKPDLCANGEVPCLYQVHQSGCASRITTFESLFSLSYFRAQPGERRPPISGLSGDGGARRFRVREIGPRVRRWQSGTMVLLWGAAGVLEAERGFRKIAGYRSMSILVAGWHAHDAETDRAPIVDDGENAA